MSGDDRLYIFTEDAVGRLAHARTVVSSAGDYSAFASELAKDESNVLHVPWSFGSPAPDLRYRRDLDRSESVGQDVSNAKELYAYLGAMTPVAGSDRRLWTYLTHVRFREYNAQRWPLDLDGWSSRVADRWLMQNPSRGALVRNGISRLWWAAALVHDPYLEWQLTAKTGDPFAYLSILLAREDAFLALIDRDTGMVRNLLFSLLDHIAERPENALEAYVRELMKEVVLRGGFTEFAGLDKQASATVVREIASQVVI
jgi:hypothetical protein